MINDLAIYGAGGLGREMAVMIDQINQRQLQWNLLGFYDDKKGSNDLNGFSILGGMYELNNIKTPLAIMVAIADPAVRKKVVSALYNPLIYYPTFIHPSVIMGATENTIRKGSIITAGCILTTGITTGEFVIINLATTIGHDVTLQDYCSIMPGCNISGGVKIGRNTFVGTGAKIIQGLEIGDDCKIGAGAVVIKDVLNNKTIVGVPGRDKNDKRI